MSLSRSAGTVMEALALGGCLEAPPLPTDDAVRPRADAFAPDSVDARSTRPLPDRGLAASDGGQAADGGDPRDALMLAEPDLTAVAGFWYIHGIAPVEEGRLEAFAAALRIERNRVNLLSNEAELLAADVTLVPAPDLDGTWLFTMPTTGVVYRGAFAPNSGFAVFPQTRRAIRRPSVRSS